MQFHFFVFGKGAMLDSIGEIEVAGPFAKAKGEVEQHFDTFIAKKSARQVIVFCTTLGKPPGHIVAVETVYLAHLNGKVKPEQQSRSLAWLVEENVPKH